MRRLADCTNIMEKESTFYRRAQSHRWINGNGLEGLEAFLHGLQGGDLLKAKKLLWFCGFMCKLHGTT